jgi:polar amino acid transport system substrate-binding protein
MASTVVVSQLAPTGVLRAGINLSNFLLVTGRTPAGDPAGVFARHGRGNRGRPMPLRLVPCAKSPGELADAAGTAPGTSARSEPSRPAPKDRVFTPAYVEIEATYLVPAGSPLRSVDEVDRPGVRIAVAARSAYDLWLERNIHQATLMRATGLDAAYDLFVAQGLEALAGLKPRLLTDVEKLPGARILPGRFTAVQQAVGTARANTEPPSTYGRLRRTRQGAATWLPDRRHQVVGCPSHPPPEGAPMACLSPAAAAKRAAPPSPNCWPAVTRWSMRTWSLPRNPCAIS